MSYKRTSPIVVTEGGTGVTTMTTAYAPVCAGTTATGALQVASTGLGTSGFVLTSNGSSSLPSFQSAGTLQTLSITGNTGGALVGSNITFSGGTTGLSFGGSVTTQTLTFAGITANGGTVSLATDATTSTINIGTGAGVKTSTFGSTNTTSTTTIQGGTGGVQIANTFLNMPATTSTAGQLRINNTRVLHAFATSANNDDFFAGPGAGNFTASSTNGGNTAVGSIALQALTSGEKNTFVGASAGQAITSGSYNVGIGSNGLVFVTTGSRNVQIGANATANNLVGASDNIFINNPGTVGDNNVMRLASATGTGNYEVNKTFIHGIRGITTVNNDAIAVLVDSAGQLGTVSSSIRYKENVVDMGDVSSPILQLRPVTFDFIGKPSHKKHVGLIAEEVEQVMPSLVAYNQDGEVESVKYHDLPVLLLNELKKAVKRVEELESKIK